MILRQAALYLTLAALAIAGLFVGAADLTPSEVWAAMSALVGFGDGGSLTDSIVVDIRLPRILGGVLVGVALAVAGVGLQGVTRNRLADPYLLGISSGAGVGFLVATLMTSTGAPPIAAVGGSMAAAALGAVLVTWLAGLVRYADGIILIGVALNFVFLAWTMVVIFAVDSPRLPTFAYFVFGSLGTVTWPYLWTALPVVAIAVVLIARMARALDLLSIGDDDATGLGVDVRRVSLLVLVTTGAAVGASVAIAGVVGFVGLVAPLVARRLVGPSHGALIAASAALGGIFVLASDTFIRGAFGQVEVPLGIVTAAIGGPVLVVMLVTGRQE